MKPDCPHDAVEEELYRPTWLRGFGSYRELCLDCGATRCREFNRFRWGKWSKWIVSDREATT